MRIDLEKTHTLSFRRLCNNFLDEIPIRDFIYIFYLWRKQDFIHRIIYIEKVKKSYILRTERETHKIVIYDFRKSEVPIFEDMGELQNLFGKAILHCYSLYEVFEEKFNIR